jgi:hypothetical protein
MENLDSEYPTNEQIKETWDAYLKGGDALLELMRKKHREAAEATESGCREHSDSAVTPPTGS